MAQIQASASTPPPQQSNFPQDPADFDADPRISFDKLNQKFILETEDDKGHPLEYEFDDGIKRWIPVLDENDLERQRTAYAVKGVDESEPVQAGKKRKKPEHENGNGNDYVGGPQTKHRVPTKPAGERKNTAIYVTNLPQDTDVDEVKKVFSRCGVIAEEIDGQKPRIKLYMDDQGNLKGDALIVYFRAESVDLAVQMLDDSQFRLGEGPSMKVGAADFSYKQQKGASTQDAKAHARDKTKIIKKTQKLNSKLADWDDDDPQTLEETSSRWDKVVILKHMFTLQELEEDPAAMLDIKEDIRLECSKLGPVTNVVLFDREDEGVATVRYSNAEAARACVRQMDGRHYSGMVVKAYIADGSEKFRKSAKKTGLEDDEDDSGDEEDRLNQFGEWLESDKKK